MSGGYLYSDEFIEDSSQTTAPQQLADDSACGAALLVADPAPADAPAITLIPDEEL